MVIYVYMFGSYTFASTHLGGLLVVSRPVQIGKCTPLRTRRHGTQLKVRPKVVTLKSRSTAGNVSS